MLTTCDTYELETSFILSAQTLILLIDMFTFYFIFKNFESIIGLLFSSSKIRNLGTARWFSG